MLVSALPVSAKSDESKKQDQPFRVEISKDKKDVTITSNGKNTDKNSIEEAIESYSVKEKQKDKTTKLKVSNSATLYDYDYSDYSDGDLSSKLDTDITWGVIEDLRASGYSKVSWSGTNPFYCDNIAIEDIWTITGIDVDFSFGSEDWSVSGGVTSKTASWEKDYDDEWIIKHEYSNLEFNGYELYVKQRVVGHFEFGTTTYSVTALDSTTL